MEKPKQYSYVFVSYHFQAPSVHGFGHAFLKIEGGLSYQKIDNQLLSSPENVELGIIGIALLSFPRALTKEEYEMWTMNEEDE
mgnify:CR=1 FL=1